MLFQSVTPAECLVTFLTGKSNNSWKDGKPGLPRQTHFQYTTTQSYVIEYLHCGYRKEKRVSSPSLFKIRPVVILFVDFAEGGAS